MSPPKYALMEIERRWLIPNALARPLLNNRPVRITDTYLNDTRLRLRRVEQADGTLRFKFCRKYGDRDGPAESITNLYLEAAEYELLASLPGARVTKYRYQLDAGAIDVYGQETLHVFEIEFAGLDAARRYTPPGFVSEEITGNDAFSGLSLARQFQ